MNVLDIAIIVLILLGAIIGFNRGFLSEFLSFSGMVIVIIAAFIFKNSLSIYLYKHLPFISFPGLLSGISVVNILFYEVVAFFIIAIVLYIILKAAVLLTNLMQKLFDGNFVISFPNKLAGAALGLIEHFVLVFIALYVLSLPFFDINIVKNSKVRMVILEKTPVLNVYVKGAVKVGSDFWDLAEKYRNKDDLETLNLETLDLLLKYKVTDVDSIDYLVDQNKIQINNIESVLLKYRKETSD